MAAPVKHTCPDIDHCLKYLKYAEGSLKSALDRISDVMYHCEPSEQNELKSAKREIESAISDMDISGMLEELRSANDALRSWGYGLEDEISKLESEISQLNF